jgi:hypothetical protein
MRCAVLTGHPLPPTCGTAHRHADHLHQRHQRTDEAKFAAVLIAVGSNEEGLCANALLNVAHIKMLQRISSPMHAARPAIAVCSGRGGGGGGGHQ